MGNAETAIERINKIVDSYKDFLIVKKKKKPFKKEIEKTEIQNRSKRPCIFPGCNQNITSNRGTSFCFDHKFLTVRKAFILNQGYTVKDAEYYSKVRNFPIFLGLLRRKLDAKAGNNKKSR